MALKNESKKNLKCSNFEVDELALYLSNNTLLSLEQFLDLNLSDKRFLIHIESLPGFSIVNGELPYGDIQLNHGFTIENDDLIETSMASLCITSNDLIVYPIESFRVNAHIVYFVKLIGQAPEGYHQVLKYWASFMKGIRTSIHFKKKRWVKAVSEFCISMWYDSDIQDDVLGLNQDEFYEYLNRL